MKTCIKKLDLTDEYYFDEGCFITEVSNSTDDLALSIARARVEPGQTTKWHSLRGITERYVIIEGTGKVEVGDLDARVVTAGDVIIIAPGERQRIENIGQGSLIFLALCTPRFEESAYVSLQQ
jgi:mannose-6-phosphate isomerase-like protein (cupin superfamily)